MRDLLTDLAIVGEENGGGIYRCKSIEEPYSHEGSRYVCQASLVAQARMPDDPFDSAR